MLFCLLVLACLFVSGLSETSYACPSTLKSYWSTRVFNRHCYAFLLGERKDFHDAQRFCELNGGYLAMIKNNETNNFLTHVMAKHYNHFYTPVWIGLKHLGDKSYQWLDGTSLGPFAPLRERDSYDGEYCVGLVTKTKTWIEMPCKSDLQSYFKHPFICEYPAVLVETTIPPVFANQTWITKEECPVRLGSDKSMQVYRDKCYYFGLEHEEKYEDAQQFCELHGGTLAMVKSEEVNSFLYHHITQTHGMDSMLDQYWIGLAYNKSRNGYFWVDGTPMGFNRLGEYKKSECVTLQAFFSIIWNEKPCYRKKAYFLDLNARLGFICEFKTSSTEPTPVTFDPRTTTDVIAETTVTSTCPSILCDVDCGMAGYKEDEITGCTMCQCEN